MWSFLWMMHWQATGRSTSTENNKTQMKYTVDLFVPPWTMIALKANNITSFFYSLQTFLLVMCRPGLKP